MPSSRELRQRFAQPGTVRSPSCTAHQWMNGAQPFEAREHRHLDRHGDGWRGERDGVEGEGGWPLYLKRFAEIAGS